jgi:hypothetical protein
MAKRSDKQKVSVPQRDGGSIPAPPLQEQMHAIAKKRFKADPSKCYQRHIREVWAEYENKPKIPPEALKGGRVKQITRAEAESFILKYEWLAADPLNAAPLGRGVSAFYGLWLDGELIGANCLGVMGGQIGNICGPEYAKETICIMRGACAPHTPKETPSYFTRNTCRRAYRDFGWKIFFAYSDPSASEVGVIYEASRWYYFGQGVGRKKDRDGKDRHYNYLSPDGTQRITSYQLNHDKNHKLAGSFGWTPELRDPDDSKKPYSKRKYLLHHDYTQEEEFGKSKWVWFEGAPKERAQLLTKCEHRLGKPLPYPRRANWQPHPKRRTKAPIAPNEPESPKTA